MTSDWRVVDEPLAWLACDTCGLARRRPSAALGDSFYRDGYTLYAHAPGGAAERVRQEQYAGWIVPAVTRPARVLDIGCGNGSLLRALRTHWPEAELLGCDPSADAIAHGSGDGLRLWPGTADDLPPDVAADLVVSINVLEHTDDPGAFVAAARHVLSPGGQLILVCPDGSRPGLDLLFADHQFSFARQHLDALVQRAGIDAIAWSQAPAALGAFQMIVGTNSGTPRSRPLSPPSSDDRRAFFDRWRNLDQALLSRLPGTTVCFGAGEAAGLLRAYAPRAWQSVYACTMDGHPHGRFGSLPLIGLDEVHADDAVLVGVRPIDQPRVAERLRGRFPRVITWYDLVDGEPRS
jgi:SAM-dependent methyltransferase